MNKEIIKRPEMKLVGIEVRTNNISEFNHETAKIYPTIIHYFNEGLALQIKNKLNPGTTICAYTDYESDHTGDYTYFIGEKVSSFEDAPDNFALRIIPEQTYVKFTTGPGLMPDVCISAWQAIWTMKQEDLGGERRYHTDFEIYDERAQDQKNATLDVYIGIL